MTSPLPSPWIERRPRALGARVLLLLVLVVGCLLGAFWGAAYVFDGVRAYTQAEGFYVKGQKDAAHHLAVFARSSDPARLDRFRAALAVPGRYAEVHRILDEPYPDAARARTLLRHNGHTEAEAATLVRLYPLLGRFDPLRPALAAWSRGDTLTAALDALGRQAEAAGGGSDEADRLAEAASAVADEVTALGVVFSNSLAGGAVWIWRLLMGLGLALGLLLVVGAGLPVVRMLRRAARADGRFRQIVQNATEVVGLIGADGTTLYISPASESVFGYPPDEMIGRNALEHVHPDDLERVAASLHEVLEVPGASGRLEYRLRHADGRWVPFEGTVKNLLHDPDIGGILASVRDVSDRAAAEAERAARAEADLARRAAEVAAAAADEARRAAEEHLRLKESFLSNMSHELRTPLTTVLGSAEILAAEARDGDAELAAAILRGGRRLQDTLSAVLDLSQIESGHLRLTTEAVDVAAVTRAVCEGVGRTGTGEVELSVPPSADVVLAQADPTALRRVLTHLVENALKFTPRGTVRVLARIADGGALVEVADTGVGIGADDLDRVFNAFEQASEGRNRTHEGSGLGLTVARGLVRAMGGRLTLQSEVGVGTVARVWLPAPARDPAPARVASDPGGAAEPI